MADVAPPSRPHFEHLTVFGGISYDTVVRVPRFVAADEKVWGQVVGHFPGGMGANLAAAFASLGGSVALVSAVGCDKAGRDSLSVLRQVNANTDRVAEMPGSTFQTIAMIDASGEKAMLLLGSSDLVSCADPVVGELRPGIDAVHIVPGRFAPHVEAIVGWRRRGIHVSFDIEPTMIEQGLDSLTWLEAANVLFCGELASRMLSSASSIELRLRELLDRGPDVVVITRGRHGAAMAARTGEWLEHRGPRVAPLNTTGAGDAFAGTFLFGLSRGWAMRQCLAAANFAGGKCTQHYGSQGVTPSLADLLQLPEFTNV